jgi:excisionase family DNA binding protein
MVADEAPDLVTIREAAKMLGVHPSTLRNWDRAGRLKAVRVGSRRDRRFKKAEVLAEAQAQRRDDLVTANDLKQAARLVGQGSIRGAYVAEMAKTLGTTPAGLTDMLARCEAAMDTLKPMHQIARLLEDSCGSQIARLLEDSRGIWMDQLAMPVLQALPTIKESLAQLTAPALQAIPTFHELVEPILWEQKLFGDHMRDYLASMSEAFPSNLYQQFAATQAELFSSQSIASLMASLGSSSISQITSLVSEQMTANIGAYQDLARAALWDLEAVAVAGDKRLPFAELKLAAGLLQSATTLVADLPAGAGDAHGATVRKPNCFRYLHRQAQELEATEELSDPELEAQVRDLRSFQACNTGLQLVELWRHINRVAQLNGQEPIFRPSVDAVAIAARLPLSFAGDEAELGELVDGLFKLIFEASAKGHRLQAVADPREYETVKDIVILRQYYRHDQAQEKSARACERNFGRLGDIFQRLVGKRYPSSPADWQRACLALMRQTLAFLRAVADKLEDLK